MLDPSNVEPFSETELCSSSGYFEFLTTAEADFAIVAKLLSDEKKAKKSISITFANGKFFRVDIPESYENKRERMDLIKQTFVNVGVRSSNAKLEEGFLFKGLRLNKIETERLLCACNNNWCFYLCKFYLLEELIKTNQINLEQWTMHLKNIAMPLCKKSVKMETSQKNFSLFGEDFTVKTSPDVATAIWQTMHTLEGNDHFMTKGIKPLSLCPFVKRFNKARCAVAKHLHVCGEEQKMKLFLISQLNQFFPSSHGKKRTCKDRKEETLGPKAPSKKRNKATVSKAAPEEMNLDDLALKSVDSPSPPESPPYNSPIEDDVPYLKQDVKYLVAEKDLENSEHTQQKDLENPDRTQRENVAERTAKDVVEEHFEIENKTPETTLQRRNAEPTLQYVGSQRQAYKTANEYSKAFEQRNIRVKVKKKVWAQVIVWSVLIYAMDLYLPQRDTSTVEFTIGFLLGLFLVFYFLNYKPRYFFSVLTIVYIHWMRDTDFLFVHGEIYGTVALQMLCLQKKYLMLIPMAVFVAYLHFSEKSWIMLLHYSVTLLTFFKCHRAGDEISAILICPYRDVFLLLSAILISFFHMFGMCN